MKKIVLLSLFTLTALFSRAQSIISNQTGAGQVSDKTAQVSADLYGAVGVHYKVVVIKKSSSTNFMPDDSLVSVIGNGFTNPVPVSFTLDSLNPSTTYYYEFRLYKAYGDSGLIQTTSSGYYFTTTATPQSGVINSVTVQPIVGGLRLIVVGNTNGSTSNLVGYTNEATYSGGGWSYQSETDVLPGVFSSFTDTLTITNLNSVSYKIQIRLLPTNGMPAVVSSFYYGTPLSGTKPTVNTPTINVGVDTVQIITRITKGNTDSNWVFIRILDSAGTALLMTLPTQSMNSTLVNYFRQANLTPNTQYTAEIVAYNSVGRDSARYSFRTNKVPYATISYADVSSLQKYSATVKVILNPNGLWTQSATKVWIDYNGRTSDTVMVNPSTGNQTVYITLTGLSAGTTYSYTVFAQNANTTGSSVLRSFTTLQKIIAPAVSFTGNNSPNCGYVLIGGIRIIPVTGDTARAYILMSSDGGNMFDTVFARLGITNQLDIASIRVSTPMANHMYYFKLVGVSKDTVTSTTSTVSTTTPSGSTPTMIAAVVTPIGIPEISVSGDGMCDSATVTIEVFQGLNRVQYYVIPVGSGIYNINKQILGLDSLKYDVNVCISNGYGPRCTSLVIDRSSLATGIKNNISKLEGISLFPNPSNGFITIDGVRNGTITVTDMLGQTIYQSSFMNQINISGKASGNYVLKIENEDGVFMQKIILQ